MGVSADTSASLTHLPESSIAPLTPIAFLQRSAYVYGDQVATASARRTTTYAELLERTECVAGALRARGVRPGDRVAALLPNVPAMLELHFAVPGSGAILVPINTRLGPSELRYIVEHSGSRIVFVHASLRERASEALEALASPVDLIVVGGATDEYELLIASAQAEALSVAADTDVLSINYTSGTTHAPKGAMYVHRGAYLHSLGVLSATGIDRDSRYLWTLPMFHCNGWAFTWAVTAAGGRHVCLETFDPRLVWQLLHDDGITHFCGAPTVLTMLVDAPEARPLPAAVQAFIGGSAPSPALLVRAEELGIVVTQLYGLTETYGPLCVCVRKPSWEDRDPVERSQLVARQGVGTLTSEPLRVVDVNLNDVPTDGTTIGEVVMRGNNVAAGYYRAPDLTAEAFVGGWFHSGDLAVMHADGYLELRDRAKDVIISGGETISTIEIEHTLCAHPAVREAAVIAVPDNRWGEVPRAFIITRGEARADPEELRDWVRSRIARYKVPRDIVFLDELPKTATNKVQKFLLRQRSLETDGDPTVSAQSGPA